MVIAAVSNVFPESGQRGIHPICNGPSINCHLVILRLEAVMHFSIFPSFSSLAHPSPSVFYHIILWTYNIFSFHTCSYQAPFLLVHA